LGRDGAVCPFIPPALEKERLSVTVTDIEPRVDLLCRMLSCHKDVFKEQREEGGDDPDAIYNCTLILCEACLTKEDAAAMDKAQAQMKVAFMQEGLMIGQFHPFSTIEGLHNKAFRPFQAPVFCYAIRQMIPGDKVFVAQNLSEEQVVAALSAFREKFGGAVL
jgi:hypothetical protein